MNISKAMKKLPMREVYKAQLAFTGICNTPDCDNELTDFGYELYLVALNELHSRTPKTAAEALMQVLSLSGEEHVLTYLALSRGFQVLGIPVPEEVSERLSEDAPQMARLFDDVKVASC